MQCLIWVCIVCIVYLCLGRVAKGFRRIFYTGLGEGSSEGLYKSVPFLFASFDVMLTSSRDKAVYPCQSFARAFHRGSRLDRDTYEGFYFVGS